MLKLNFQDRKFRQCFRYRFW